MMNTTFDDDHFLFTLVQSGGQGCNITLIVTQNSNIVVKATPFNSKKRLPNKKVQRCTSFIIEDDNLIVFAWLNISIYIIMVPIKNSLKCEKGYEIYHEYQKSNDVKRLVWSLMNC